MTPASPDDSMLFRALLETSRDNIYVIGRDLRYKFVSRGAILVTNRTAEDMIGKTWRELGLQPEFMEDVEREWRHVLTTGETIQREITVETVAGPRNFEYVLSPIHSGPEIVAVSAISRDVTDRAIAAAELRKAEERYRSFITHSSEGIWRFEFDDPIPTDLPLEEQVRLSFERAYLAECNEVVARMYGFDRVEDITGTRLSQMLDPKEEANWEYLRAFIRSGYRLDGAESIEVDRFGRRKFFINSLTGTVEKGFLLRAWGTQRDITDQKAATERLRLSEERLQTLVQTSEQVIWTTDSHGAMEWIANSWTEATGQSHKEAKGTGWLRTIHPDDRARTEELWQEAVLTRHLFDHSLRLRMLDGSYRWFHMRATPVFNDDGSVREWIGATNDIDAEIQQEAMIAADRIRAEFVARANDLFVRSLDYEQTLRSVARLTVPQLADWCAVDMVEPDGTLRRLAVEHIDPEKVRLAYELKDKYPTNMDSPLGVANVVRTGRTEFQPEMTSEILGALAVSAGHLELLRKLQLRSYIATAIRVGGEVTGVLSLVTAESGRLFTSRDVEMAEALALRAGHAIENARLYRQAVDANRAKDDFLATLSHELRTPLTLILGWANLLRLSNYDRETMRTAVETIERSARTQAAIIDDLLDVSRIVTGKFQLNPELIDVVSILRNVVDSSRPAAEGKHLAVEIAGPPAMIVRADPNRLQQIVWNLISNAVKFSDDGGKIVVSVARKDEAAEISVSDDGAGIPAEVLPRVFDRFWQADSSSNRAHGGLGLGLAIVKHLAEMHGGTVRASSGGPGQGASFTVVLPADPPSVERAGGLVLASTASKHVLLVDDDDGARLVIARMLELYGARVTQVSNASEALEQVKRESFDLVLTDLAMPEYDGYWLLERLRESHPSTRVAAVTALGISDDQMRQFDSFIRKPVDPARLAALLSLRST